MATAEQMATSIRIEGRGIFVLLWDAKEDLVRALLVLNAALHDIPTQSHLLAPGEEGIAALRKLIETRVIVKETESAGSDQSDQQYVKELWYFFVQQASSSIVGPWLNGWRRALRKSPGTILVIRHTDFEPFQRSAPDLASFVGPRTFNASTMLPLFSHELYRKLIPTLREPFVEILRELPGVLPAESEIKKWIATHAPVDGE